MPTIKIRTEIEAPIERVFDLARSIDVHKVSTSGTNEHAVAGRMSGLIEKGEIVTWEARHFGIKQQLTVQVTALERPNRFEDEMIAGAFQSMHHRHLFEESDDRTIMHDELSFSARWGFLGRLAECLFLNFYMKRFLKKRNAVLKKIAESDQWQGYL